VAESIDALTPIDRASPSQTVTHHRYRSAWAFHSPAGFKARGPIHCWSSPDSLSDGLAAAFRSAAFLFVSALSSFPPSHRRHRGSSGRRRRRCTAVPTTHLFRPNSSDLGKFRAAVESPPAVQPSTAPAATRPAFECVYNVTKHRFWAPAHAKDAAPALRVAHMPVDSLRARSAAGPPGCARHPRS
jgi:hypothetical protein